MNKQVSWEVLTEFEASCQEEDYWGEHSPQIKVSQVSGEGSLKRYLNVVLTRAQISAECEGSTEQGPHKKEETPAQPPAVSVVEALRLVWIQFLAHDQRVRDGPES